MLESRRLLNYSGEVLLNTPSQLSLPLSLPDDETFDSFYAGENASLVAAIQTAIHQSHGSYIYFWSRDGGGKSHLLHAACAELSLAGWPSRAKAC